MNNNFDERGKKRFNYEAAIWHQNLLPGRFYKAAICNISPSGLYFESNQTLSQGEVIYIGSKSPVSTKNIPDKSAGVAIKWRKDLKDSSFRFGYGAEFIDLYNPLIKSIDKTKISNQSTRGAIGRHGKDPREHPREPYRKEINFSTNHGEYKGSIVNISRGGTFITTKSKFALGQMIQLDIRDDKTCKAIRLKGWVVRLGSSGVGVKFDRRIRLDRRKAVDRRGRKKPAKRQASLRT